MKLFINDFDIIFDYVTISTKKKLNWNDVSVK